MERCHQFDSPGLRPVLGTVHSSGDPPVSMSGTRQAGRVTGRNRLLIKSSRAFASKGDNSLPVSTYDEAIGSEDEAEVLHRLVQQRSKAEA